MTMIEMHKRVAREMDRKDIDFDSIGSDLYLRVNPISQAIMADYDWVKMVSIFRDAIDHDLWFDVPFAKFPVDAMMEEVRK